MSKLRLIYNNDSRGQKFVVWWVTQTFKSLTQRQPDLGQAFENHTIACPRRGSNFGKTRFVNQTLHGVFLDGS